MSRPLLASEGAVSESVGNDSALMVFYCLIHYLFLPDLFLVHFDSMPHFFPFVSPEQFILAGFPLHDNLNPGLKTHKTTSTTPDIGRPGRVLLPY